MKDKNNRLRHCPECYKIKRSGKNDDRYFFEVCPEGKEMWDYSINEYDVNISDILQRIERNFNLKNVSVN